MCTAYQGFLREGNKKWGRLALIFLQLSNWIAHWIAESILTGLNVLCCFGCWKVFSYDLVQLGPDVAQAVYYCLQKVLRKYLIRQLAIISFINQLTSQVAFFSSQSDEY